MAYLDHFAPLTVPLRPLPPCTYCGVPFSFDRAILVVEQVYYEAGNCPRCCAKRAGDGGFGGDQ